MKPTYEELERENERIKGAALALMLHSIPHEDKTTIIQNRHIKALADAIREQSNKPTGVEAFHQHVQDMIKESGCTMTEVVYPKTTD